MRRLFPPAALLAAVLVSGCAGNSTAIIVEVTKGEGVADMDQLRFAVGSRLVSDAETAPLVADPAASVDADVTGRDLTQSPYRLYIDNGLPDMGPITVVVLGFAGQELAGFGIAGPQEFIARETIVVHVVLTARSNVNPLPTGCVWWTENGQRQSIGTPEDHDCDGFSPPQDCDDDNFRVNPSVSERCDNGIDDNCNDQTDESVDADGDGVTTCDGDCDDNDPDVHPGAPAICDGKDNSCDGNCDGAFDHDGDGVTTCGTIRLADNTCAGSGPPDCNDDDPDIHPGEEESCDGKDNNCSGMCDEDSEFDRDQDGFTTCGTIVGLPPVAGICGAPSVAFEDCEEDDDAVHPFGHQICDGKANACTEAREMSEPCFVSVAGPVCKVGVRLCDDNPGDAGSGGLEDACAPNAAIPFNVDLPLCSAYASCDSDPEPWLCAAKQAALQKRTCDVPYRLIPGTSTTPPSFALCPGLQTPLPRFPPAATCVWDIAGGIIQEQYVVSLPVPTQCDGSLVIDMSRAPLPQPADLILFYGDETRLARAAFVYTLRPKLVATCSGSTLSCMMN